MTFEEGKAAWITPLCKLGIHRWVRMPGVVTMDLCYMLELDPKYLGFKLDLCGRRCGVKLFKKAH